MKPPAEKCAERIENGGRLLLLPSHQRQREIAAIIQSEYAETFKVAREAINNAIGLLGMEVGMNHRLTTTIRELRTALKQLPK